MTPLLNILRFFLVFVGILLIVLLLFLSMFLGQFSIIAIALAVGIGYGGWFLVTSFSLEYEYSLTNGEIDIDKIIAQRKRKRMITVVCREVEAMGKYKKAEHVNRTYKTRIVACEDENDSENTWYLVYNSVNFGKTLVVFNPPQKMISGMMPYLPKTLSYDLQRNGLN